jgi:hypothetical protein
VTATNGIGIGNYEPPPPPLQPVQVLQPVQPLQQRSAPTATKDARLPIFDAVESEWFRRGGKPGDMSWTSPADEGFRAASATVATPVTGENTSAGLPKRVPSANLLPGTVGGVPGGPGAGGGIPGGLGGGIPGNVPGGVGGTGPQTTPPSAAAQAAEAARSRMSGFARGGREGRAAAAEN